jgi:hypothetical protein
MCVLSLASVIGQVHSLAIQCHSYQWHWIHRQNQQRKAVKTNKPFLISITPTSACVLTSIPDVGIADDGRLKVNASFQMGLVGSFALPHPVFFFLTRFPLIIKYNYMEKQIIITSHEFGNKKSHVNSP